MSTQELRHSIYNSALLAERPSFLKGMASIFDFAGNLNARKSYKSAQLDADAIREDWQAVGEDLRTAMHQYEGRD